MAREYVLFCNSCKEFMDIHKFRIIPHVYNESPLGINGVKISQAEIDEGIKNSGIEPGNKDHYWILDLLPFINKFSGGHADHDLRIVDDGEPDYHWWPEHTGYTGWKEIVTTLHTELFLPRNLIDDLQITEWSTAEMHLRSLQVILYDELELKEYRDKFNQLISRPRF